MSKAQTKPRTARWQGGDEARIQIRVDAEERADWQARADQWQGEGPGEGVLGAWVRMIVRKAIKRGLR